MSGKVLLREFYALCDGGVCQDYLTESEKMEMSNGTGFYMTGVMQRADLKNGNGRVYPRKVLEREIENYKRLVEERRALGELDHPDDPVINLRNTSHLVTKIWWEGNDVKGKVKVLNTPSGKVLQELAKSGVTLGISSRGLGSTSQGHNGLMVEDDFQLICFDFVSEPSTPGAFMMKEVKDGYPIEKSDRIFRALNEVIKK
jgi:hypothetical protein